jgi:hypothetical protein
MGVATVLPPRVPGATVTVCVCGVPCSIRNVNFTVASLVLLLASRKNV